MSFADYLCAWQSTCPPTVNFWRHVNIMHMRKLHAGRTTGLLLSLTQQVESQTSLSGNSRLRRNMAASMLSLPVGLLTGSRTAAHNWRPSSHLVGWSFPMTALELLSTREPHTLLASCCLRKHSLAGSDSALDLWLLRSDKCLGKEAAAGCSRDCCQQFFGQRHESGRT